LRERWGGIYPKIVERWESKAYALFAFLRHPKPIRRYLYTTNQLERLAKEVKRRTKVVEVFCGEEAVAKLLILGPPNRELPCCPYTLMRRYDIMLYKEGRR
jgi:transposase-like protein